MRQKIIDLIRLKSYYKISKKCSTVGIIFLILYCMFCTIGMMSSKELATFSYIARIICATVALFSYSINLIVHKIIKENIDINHIILVAVCLFDIIISVIMLFL